MKPLQSPLFSLLTIVSEPTTTLVAASSVIRPDPDAPVRVPFQMNGVTYLMTEDEIQAHMDKVERLKKVAVGP